MTINANVAAIIKQIDSAKNNEDVEKIIQLVIADMEGKLTIRQCLNKLSIAIENLHPLECTSRQWSCYRYALICIGEASVMHA